MKDLQQRVENWLVRRPNSDFVWIAAAFFLLSLGISGIWEMWIVGLITGLAFVLLVLGSVLLVLGSVLLALGSVLLILDSVCLSL